MIDFRDVAIGVAFILVPFAILLAGILWITSAQCHAKFDGAILPHRWSIMGGCQVKAPQQGWIPAENYRVL